MVSSRLTRLIEKHSQELAAGLTAELLRSERTSDFRKIPPDELQRTTAEVYCNLGEWLLRKTERDIEQRFRAIAARRASEGVALHQFVLAMTVSRNYLWKYLREEAFADTILALYDGLELQQLLSQFFDRAIYYGVLGFGDRREQESTAVDLAGLRRWIDPLSV